MLPDSDKRNTKAILHGIGHVLHGFNQEITEEPLPQALTELVKRLEATLTRSSRNRRPSTDVCDQAGQFEGELP
jgi:hypothetical protein